MTANKRQDLSAYVIYVSSLCLTLKLTHEKLDIHLNIWTKEKGRQIVEKRNVKPKVTKHFASWRAYGNFFLSVTLLESISTTVALGE